MQLKLLAPWRVQLPLGLHCIMRILILVIPAKLLKIIMMLKALFLKEVLNQELILMHRE